MIWFTRLKNGANVHLRSLVVDTTYACQLEGFPSARLNAEILKSAIRDAQRQFRDWPVYMFEPPVKETQWEENPVPILPSFRCIGLFQSVVPRTPDMDASGLVVVWFQDESTVNGIELSLSELDWFTHAKDFEY